MINIAVLGYGTIGSGIVEVLQTNKKNISEKAGQDVNLKYVLDIRDFPGSPIEDKLVHDFNIILNDPEIDIIAEVMGGIEPAYTYTKQALEHGINVCTSNKELVAKHGPELLKVARDNNRNFLFEASVGGGIPIIRPLNKSLTVDELSEITGILNGTTNYILTKMSQEGSDFGETLKEAQELGYAERNPEADVEGYDACRKIAILASLAFGRDVDYEDIYTEGITKISRTDCAYAKQLGMVIKLIGTTRRDNNKFYAMVCPMLIGSNHPLYGVNGVFNGILVKGNLLGDVMFYGKGAGKLPTASAVVSDIIEEIKHLKRPPIITYWTSEELKLTSIGQASMKYFIRFSGSDDLETIKKIEDTFGSADIITIEDAPGEFAVITPEMTENEFNEKLKGFDNVITRIRIGE